MTLRANQPGRGTPVAKSSNMRGKGTGGTPSIEGKGTRSTNYKRQDAPNKKGRGSPSKQTQERRGYVRNEKSATPKTRNTSAGRIRRTGGK